MTLVGRVNSAITTLAVSGPFFAAIDVEREERVRCISPDCRRLVYVGNVRNYGAGPVCPRCYDAWFRTED